MNQANNMHLSGNIECQKLANYREIFNFWNAVLTEPSDQNSYRPGKNSPQNFEIIKPIEKRKSNLSYLETIFGHNFRPHPISSKFRLTARLFPCFQEYLWETHRWRIKSNIEIWTGIQGDHRKSRKTCSSTRNRNHWIIQVDSSVLFMIFDFFCFDNYFCFLIIIQNRCQLWI